MNTALPAALLLAASAPACLALESLGVTPDSAASLGMSGGRYANFPDPSTLRYAPSNILRFTQPELEVNAQLWHGDVKFTNVAGQSVKMDDPWKMLGSFYYIHPIKPGKLAWGVGLSAPYGLDSQWPKTGALQHLIPYDAMLLNASLDPVIAWQAAPWLDVAAGLSIQYSKLELKQTFPWSLAAGGLPFPDGELSFDGDGWGLGAFAGVTIHPAKNQRIIITGRLPLEVDYEGDFESTGMPEELAALGLTPQSDFKSNIKYPATIAAGYGIDVNDRLTIGVDFQWAQNSSHDDVPLDIGNNQALLGSDGVTLDWQDSVSAGIGASYQLNDIWTLRAGYMFLEGSMPDRTYTPAIASNDIHLLTAGVGYRRGRHSFDLAYSYSLFPDREVSGNQQPAFNGHYDMNWQVLAMSWRIRF